MVNRDRLADLPAVLTPAEVARTLRIGRRQCYEALARGEIRAVRIGSSWRIPRSAIAELLGEVESAGEDRVDAGHSAIRLVEAR